LVVYADTIGHTGRAVGRGHRALGRGRARNYLCNWTLKKLAGALGLEVRDLLPDE
jgi:hypothetical protein